MNPITIDLNADLGEGFGIWRLGDDEALLRLVSSANVACGFHAGDAITMRRVCDEAARLGVQIGAQVGYRDLAGFGRRRIDVDPVELTAEVLYQIGALDACARAAGAEVSYVKPHGALYHRAAHDRSAATAVIAGVVAFGRSLPVLGPTGSALLDAARSAGLPAVAEAFADRGYTPDGTLVDRQHPGAVIADADAVVRRSVRLIRTGELTAVDGSTLRVGCDSLCVHGDTPGAVDLARELRAGLAADQISIAPFTAGR